MSSVDSSVNDTETRAIVDGDETQTIGEPRGGLSMVAEQLFRQPLDPIRLARYLLLEPLGQGAFGAVYAAYDPELNRKVAIKLLVPRNDDVDDPEKGRDRLLREAQAMAHFDHPNVVAIYDVGTYSLDPDTRRDISEVVCEGVFLVMELVDGQRFDHWVRAQPRTWREIVPPAVEAARGLSAAHAAGLVHRDFKPANVLVDRGGHPKILDFGLARLHGEAPAASGSLSASDVRQLEAYHDSRHDDSDLGGMLGESLTRTGTVLGTPRYMSLEQHRGDEANASSDQFAFCVTLYELLYGRPPFSCRRLEGLVKAKLATRDLRPPPKNDVPTWLFGVLQRGLDPDPAERFPNMQALIEALQRDPMRRRRRLGLGLVVVAATVGSSVAVGRMSQASSPCEAHADDLAEVWGPAVAERAGASFGASALPYADQSWGTLSTSLDDWAEAWVEQRVALCEAERQPGASSTDLGRSLVCLERQRRHIAGLTRVLGTADEEVVAAAGLMASELESPGVCRSRRSATPGERPAEHALTPAEAEAEEAVAEARALMGVQKDEAALDAARRASALAEDGDIDLRARAELSLASALLSTSHPGDARDQAQLAIELAERAGDDELAAEGMVVLFRALADAGDPDGAELVARLARGRVEAAMVGDRVAAMLAYQQGALRIKQGRYADAYDHLVKARALRERMHGPGHPLVAQVDNALAVSLYHTGRRDEALAAFQRAVDGFEHALGPDHPQLGRVHNNFGNFWMAAGSYDQAYEHLQRSAQINAANHPPDHISHGVAHHNLAMVARALGARHKALEHLDTSEEVRVAQQGEEHPDVLRVRALRAGVLGDLGREVEATALLKEVLGAQTSVLGAEHPETLDTTFSLVEAQLELGESEQAEALADDAIERAQAHLGDSGELGRWLVSCARVYRRVGRRLDAEQAVTRALRLLHFDSGERSPILSQAHLVRGELALDRGDPGAAEEAFTAALEILADMFGASHGRLAWPLRQRAEARRIADDREGAREDLERALEVSEGYDGPPLQRPSIRVELARVLTAEHAERIAEQLRRAREELLAVREQGPGGVVTEADALLQEIERWERSGFAAKVAMP